MVIRFGIRLKFMVYFDWVQDLKGFFIEMYMKNTRSRTSHKSCIKNLKQSGWLPAPDRHGKNSAVCVRTRMVNVNTFSTTVKDEILEG